MTNHTTDASPSKTTKVSGLAFLLVIITTILKWIWLLIKSINTKQINKSEKFWDMISNDFDKNAKAERAEQTHIKIVENVKKHLDINDIVLDYGCATGTVSIEIADNVKKIYGIDISSKMIDSAQKKVVEHKIENIDFSQSTIFDKQYTKESFNVILVLNILHLLGDTPKVIKRIHELLKPGGLFISSTECMGEKKSFINTLIFLLMKIGILPYFRFFKVFELEDSITNGIFQIVETESIYTFGSQQNHFIVAKKI